MNRLKFLLAAFVVAVLTLGVYSCAKDKESETIDSQLSDYKIIDQSFKSPRLTFGKDPGDDFYNTIFNYIETNSKDLNLLNSKLFGKTEAINSNFKYFTVLYTNKVYKNVIEVAQEDIIGFGIASFDKGYMSFKLYENNNGIPQFVRALNFRNEYPTRIFEFFKKDFKENSKLIASMIYINNGDIWKPAKESSVEFEKIMEEFRNKKSTGSRFGCGCDPAPCCDIDGCSPREIQGSYCSGSTGNWECSPCNTTETANIADNESFTFMAPAEYFADAYFIRDEFLKNSSKGRKYIDFYYDIDKLVPAADIFSAHSDIENVNFGYQTLLRAKLLLPNAANSVVINNEYYIMTKKMIKGYKVKFANNTKFMEILDYIESDVEKYNGWTKNQILNDIN